MGSNPAPATHEASAWADYAAKSPEAAIAFLRDVVERAKPYAERDVAELRRFAKDELGIGQLEAWDL